MKIKEETYSVIWGTGLIVLGLAVLLIVFTTAYGIAQDPAGKLDKWAPEDVAGPAAAFEWSSDGKNVLFNDNSVKGDADITTYTWDFGDGSTSNVRNPSHQYASFGDYTVALEVVDDNGETSNMDTIVSVQEGSNDGDIGSESFDLGFGNIIQEMGIAILVIGILAVLIMIGGRIIMAGVHLVRPTTKTLKFKLKSTDADIDLQERDSREKR